MSTELARRQATAPNGNQAAELAEVQAALPELVREGRSEEIREIADRAAAMARYYRQRSECAAQAAQAARLKIQAEASLGLIDLEATGYISVHLPPLMIGDERVAAGTRTQWRTAAVARARGVLDGVLDEIERDWGEVTMHSFRTIMQRDGLAYVPFEPVRQALREEARRRRVPIVRLAEALGVPHEREALRNMSQRKTGRMSWITARRYYGLLGRDVSELPPARRPTRRRRDLSRLRKQRRAKDPRAAEAQVRLQAFTDEFARLWPPEIGARYDHMYGHIYALRDFIADHVVREHIE